MGERHGTTRQTHNEILRALQNTNNRIPTEAAPSKDWIPPRSTEDHVLLLSSTDAGNQNNRLNKNENWKLTEKMAAILDPGYWYKFPNNRIATSQESLLCSFESKADLKNARKDFLKHHESLGMNAEELKKCKPWMGGWKMTRKRRISDRGLHWPQVNTAEWPSVFWKIFRNKTDVQKGRGSFVVNYVLASMN